MGRGALVLYRNTPENAEVAGAPAYRSNRITWRETMAWALCDERSGTGRVSPPRHGRGARTLLLGRITREYEDLLAGLCGMTTSPSQ